MPKIEVYEKSFYKLIGKTLKETELIDIMEGAKAELDEYDKNEGLLKIELNDTNRPDLWSTAGLARQIKNLIKAEKEEYPFFSTKGNKKDNADLTVEVEQSVKNIRPYITAFIAKDNKLDDPVLKDIIQSQEKMCWNFGQRR